MLEIGRGPVHWQDGEDDPSSASSSYLNPDPWQSVQLITTVLQRWNACRIHAAGARAAEYCTLKIYKRRTRRRKYGSGTVCINETQHST